MDHESVKGDVKTEDANLVIRIEIPRWMIREQPEHAIRTASEHAAAFVRRECQR